MTDREQRIEDAFAKVREFWPLEQKPCPETGIWGHLIKHVAKLGKDIADKKQGAYHSAAHLAAITVRLMVDELDKNREVSP